MNCAIVECRSRSPGHKVQFFKLPKVVTDKGIQMLATTSSCRLAWLKAISREDLPEDAENFWVCEKHFVKGGLISNDVMHQNDVHDRRIWLNINN